MTTNDMGAMALVLDQNYFALDTQSFAMFQELIDKPPSVTAGLRSTLTSRAPWVATAVDTGKSTPEA
jgi:uncharacterized protein (DUF1778 family)